MAGRDDIVIYRGSSFVREYQLVNDDTGAPIDISGKTGSFLILSKDGTTVMATGSVDIIDPASGKIKLSLPSTSTSSLKLGSIQSDPFYQAEDYIYHFDLIDNGEPTRTTYGMVSVVR